MFCPYCDANLSFQKKHCDRCGADLRIYKKIYQISNKCYNDGLNKTKVRDLSGAVEALKKSLHFNKRNTDARNLLGLVYLEMGETVSALSEWVISKHFQNEDNIADRYIHNLQSNLGKLETLNQAIKKYNLALQAARSGNNDLAIIQLKKVTSMNPKFIRAQQLLALIYMRTGDKERSVKCLNRARKIDLNNTITLKYLNELKEYGTSPDKQTKKEAKLEARKRVIKDENVSFAPVSSYKEDKPNILAWCNLVIGAIIGIAVVYYLMVPTIERRVSSEYRSEVVQHSEQLATKDATISSLEGDKLDLEKKVEDLTQENDSLKEAVSDEAQYDTLFLAAKLYVLDKPVEAAETLLTIDSKKIERPEAKKLYNEIKKQTYKQASQELYQEGYKLYAKYKYEESFTYFERAVKADNSNCNALYFLGRCYQRQGDKENAAKYYNIIVNDYPDHARVSKAKQQLRSMGY